MHDELNKIVAAPDESPRWARVLLKVYVNGHFGLDDLASAFVTPMMRRGLVEHGLVRQDGKCNIYGYRLTELGRRFARDLQRATVGYGGERK